jgi:hypothetical protein
MSVHNDAVSSASSLPELWLATVAFHEDASVGTVEAFSESVAANRSPLAERYP